MTESTWNMTRRAFLASTAAVGVAAYAGGAWAEDNPFTSVPAPANLPAANGPMRWLDSGDTKGIFFKKYMELYGQARGVETVYDGLPWQEIASVLPLGIRNGSAPDAFNLPIGMEPSVAISNDWLQPLEDYIENFDEWKNAYPDGAFVEGINVFGGKTYGAPFSTERRFNNALLFNQKMMNDVGYDHIGPDRALTFDEMRDAAKKITASSGGAFGFIIGGAQVQRWGNTATMLAQRGGATVGSTGLLEGMDFTTGEFVFGSDEYVAGVELLLGMRDDGSVFPGVLSIIAPQARQFMTQNAAGMIVQGPWNVPSWERTAPDFIFGISPGPAPDESKLENPVWVMQLPNSANMMWLNKAAKNPYHMGEFMRWVGTLDGQVAYENVASSADPAIFPDAYAKADLSEKAFAMLTMALKFVRISPNPFVRNPELSKVAAAYVDPTPNLAQSVQGLFAGELTDARATLTKAADARNKALDDAIAKAKAEGANVSRDDFIFGNWTPGKDYGPADYAAL